MRKRLENNHTIGVSWIDYFFTENIAIVGLGLNYQEIDLWWILDFRAREIYKKSKAINNHITYYCAEGEDKARLELLKSLQVNVQELKIEKKGNELNYTNYYNDLYDILKTNFHLASA